MSIRHPLETLILFTLFTKIKVGANSAFKSDPTDAVFISVTGNSVAMHMVVNQVMTRLECAMDRGRNMIVDRCEGVVGVGFGGVFDAVAAEVVVLAFQAFVSDTNNILKIC